HVRNFSFSKTGGRSATFAANRKTKKPGAPKGDEPSVPFRNRQLRGGLFTVRLRIGNGPAALLRNSDDLSKRITPSPGDDFDRMEQAILRHPPDCCSAHAQQFCRTLLR